MRLRGLVARIQRLPAYPALVVAAFVLTVFTASSSPVESLSRPLVVAVATTLLVQGFLTLVFRSVDRGALVALLVALIVVGYLQIALLLAAVMAIWSIVSIRRRVAPFDNGGWRQSTRLLNLIAVLSFTATIVTAIQADAMTSARTGSLEPIAVATGLPDVYLVMLDGYPRSDTLAEEFGFQNEPFLSEMRDLGFQVPANSHSNYNLTILTLASIFTMRHITAAVVPPAGTPQGQYRQLTRLLNRGAAFDLLHRHGYEVVGIPSPFGEDALFAADRYLDSGQLTSFEYDLLGKGVIPWAEPESVVEWQLDQHRDRIRATFARLADLANERAGRPRFILAHVMAPHPPPVFTATGESAPGWPCFPRDCLLWSAGEDYGDGIIGPTRDQVAWVNGQVVETATKILGASETPPVVIVFSDHGHRHDLSDPDEMLRSFFAAFTPGHTSLFPDNVTPINLVPRLLNAYADETLPLASEESYLVDLNTLPHTGPLMLQPWSP